MTTPTDPGILQRLRRSRANWAQRTTTRKAAERERIYAEGLPGWRTQARRRSKVKLLAATFAFQLIVTLAMAFETAWGVLLLPAMLMNLVLMTKIRKVSGGRGETLDSDLDELEIARKNDARSLALSYTHGLIAVPWVLFGFAGLAHARLDSSGVALMAFTIFLISVYLPSMVIVWRLPDPDPDV